VTDLAADVLSAALQGARDGAPWIALTRALEQSAQAVRLTLFRCGLAVGVRVAVDRLGERAGLALSLEDLDARVASLETAVEANRGRDPDVDLLAPRLVRLRSQLALWHEAVSSESAPSGQADVVRWISASTHGAQFQATPLSVADAFARARVRRPQAWILTSATLTVAASFDAFIGEIGLSATTRRWDSPFDYPRQGLLYLPEPMPSPLSDGFAEQVADAAWPIIAASDGRAFVLCSTLRAVKRISARLREQMAQCAEPMLLLTQGEGTRRNLLQAFRESGRAVLVGSVSFWEGIDVRGQALSLVVIDKLPFAPPDDPLVEARVRRLKAQGRNPFTEYQLPQAVTLLRQGVGRLIRDENDRGVLMILDGRLLSKSYGRIVLGSLPPFRITRDQRDACEFLRDDLRPRPDSSI
jgi:ATP-dependent DNA helicase DinG